MVTYSPVTSYYAPAVTTYSPVTAYSPVTTYSPITTYSPMVAAVTAPTVTYMPVTSYSPVVSTAYYAPAAVYSTYSPLVYSYARPYYVPGEPVRNFFRALAY